MSTTEEIREVLDRLAMALGVRTNRSQLEAMSVILAKDYDRSEVIEGCKKLLDKWEFNYYPKIAHIKNYIKHKPRTKQVHDCPKCHNTGLIIISEGIYNKSYRCSCPNGDEMPFLQLYQEQ